jgi:ATP-binding cassette subfamily B protein
MASTATRPQQARLFWRLTREARGQWLSLSLLGIVTLLATPLALLTPVPVAIAIDSVLGNKPLPAFLQPIVPSAAESSTTALLLFVAGLVVAIALLTQLQVVAADVLTTLSGERLLMHFRSRLFGHAQRLSLAYHDTKGTSDTTYRVQSDANALQYLWVYGVAPLLSAAFMLCGMFYVSVRIDWQLALVAIGITPVLLIVIRAYRERLRMRWHEVKDLESSSLAVVHESLTSLRVVKAFGQEPREHARYLKRAEQNVAARIGVSFMQGSFELLIGIVFALGTATVLYVGVLHVQHKTITLGELTLVLGYLTLLYQPLRTVAGSIVTLQSSLASAERVFTVLDEAPDVLESPNPVPLRRARGRIEFEDVAFGYVPLGNDAERRILESVSFEVAAGESLGIVGKTGAGKTTILNLLARCYDPSAGRILLDGVDLRDYALADLRNQFAIVLQEPVLFSTTIAENIAYGRAEASDLEIIAAAKAAHAHDFVRGLPNAYDTVVGERGMTLSGGERQRISLARAFLKDAPILLLDEPTSSVDLASETIIMDATAELMRGRTTLMIAHRLSTLSGCDTIIEVADGRVTETVLALQRTIAQ